MNACIYTAERLIVLLIASAPSAAVEPEDFEGSAVADASASPDPRRLETGLLPIVSYDSNLGIGLGALMALTQFDPEREPHRWRLQMLALVSTRVSGDGDWQVPAQRYAAELDLPEVAARLRIRARLAFSIQKNVNYFGLGSRAPKFEDRSDRFHQYERMSPSISSTMRYRLIGFERENLRPGRLEAFAGIGASYSKVTLFSDSLLIDHATRAMSLATTDDEVLADLIHGTQDHFLLSGRAGLLLDLRDNEFHPETGGLHLIGLRASPGVDASLRYIGLSASTSWFFTVVPDRLVVASRLAGDLLIGKVPFYELATFGSFQTAQGPGGADSVRGLLLRRFHGKGKVIGNLELRSEVLRSTHSAFVLGALAFVDVGRVWADIQPRTFEGRRLDGGFADMQVGIGGGLRVRFGDTFIVRADYGASPTDGTTGFYMNANHVF